MAPKKKPSITAEIKSIIDTKFEELKASILAEFIEETKRIVDEGIKSLVGKKNELVESNLGDEYANSIKQVQEQIKNVLEANEKMRNENIKLENRVDDLEQYGRRWSLRINGIPMEERETAQNVRDKVAKIISDENIDIPHFAIDRAHRVGKKKSK